jgi:hypothetical protein
MTCVVICVTGTDAGIVHPTRHITSSVGIDRVGM